MLRINRSRFIGIACLVIFIYFLVFTDTGSSNDFRTSTEASLARIRSKQNQLPLRGDLSDEDLTKKTYEELQDILESQSKDTTTKDEDGSSQGRSGRDSVPNTPVEEPDEKSKEHAERLTHNVKDTKISEAEEDPVAASRKAMQKPKYPIVDGTEKPLGHGGLSKADAEDKDVETSADPGKDFAREKLTAYLKNPGRFQ